ncbi:MAG: hypothetical protein K8F57_04755 [Alphaproteobacteria bacterium]|nr:hypothetical protein [Alphaproteobacteria bacterium]
MATQQFPKVPKIKEYVELTLTGGEVMRGYMFMEVTSRIQDVLNGENRFFPFVDQTTGDKEEVILINKDSVGRVTPHDG